MKMMNENELKKFLSELFNGNLPQDIENIIINTIPYQNNVNSPNYTVKMKDEAGTIRLEVELLNIENGYSKKEKYIIEINNKTKQYQINGVKKYVRMDLGCPDYEEQFELSVDYQNNAWNNKPGYIITSDNRFTKARKNGSTYILQDSRDESVKKFTENGVEMKSEFTSSYYPERKEVNYSFGVPKNNFRPTIEKAVNHRFRESIGHVVNYITVYDITGKETRRYETYYNLNNEKTMGPIRYSGEITESQFRNGVEAYKNLTTEEIENILSQTPELAKNDLLEEFYPHLVQTSHRHR